MATIPHRFALLACAGFAAAALVADVAMSQQGPDGNPHNWDRRRRCDQTGEYTVICRASVLPFLYKC